MRYKLGHDRLLEVLTYHRSTGQFFWKVAPSKRIPAGAAAGHLNAKSGYLTIRVDGVLYQAHVLAWFYVHQEWMPGMIDHRNRVRSDNRLKNLRPATRSQNNRNKKSLGVSFYKRKRKWTAKIMIDYSSKHLGYFDTFEEALKVRRLAESIVAPEFYGRASQKGCSRSLKTHVMEKLYG